MQNGDVHIAGSVAAPNRVEHTEIQHISATSRSRTHVAAPQTPLPITEPALVEGSPSKTRAQSRVSPFLASLSRAAGKIAIFRQPSTPLPLPKESDDDTKKLSMVSPRRLLWPKSAKKDVEDVDIEKGFEKGFVGPVPLAAERKQQASANAGSRVSHKSQPSVGSNGRAGSEYAASIRSSATGSTDAGRRTSRFREALGERNQALDWTSIPITPARPPTADSSISSSSCPYPHIPEPQDPAKRLTKHQLWLQRVLVWIVVGILNGICVVAYVQSDRHLWVLVLILFVKAKDVLSTLAAVTYLSSKKIWKTVTGPPQEAPPKQILSMITCYNETEDQIMKTVDSIRENELDPHSQILCLILDGKPKEQVKRRMLRTAHTLRRPYFTWQHTKNEVVVDCGFLDGSPIIWIEKVKNTGKKDSLILGHDLFNHMREDASQYTKLLREEIWSTMLPSLMGQPGTPRIDAIFCTDADSTIHKDAMKKLAEALARDKRAIAACGVLFAELGNTEWTIWGLFQQFQYCYGQLVRRTAEGIWGRVTCLPGCITMIACRPEMGPAIRDYAAPVRDVTFFRHQVQYLGTDRRLTYSMVSQSSELKTLFVPSAVSETVVPQSLMHYLNQRRRWGSNAYFNNWYYFLGRNQYLITRLWALIDISRMTIVYVRQANNILFIYGLARNFSFIKILPLLIVTQIPSLWFLTLIITTQPLMRRRIHKLFLGLVTNYCISWCLSILVFTRIVLQLGSTAWGRTGMSSAPRQPLLQVHTPENSLATRLSSLIGSIAGSDDGRSRHSRGSSQGRGMSAAASAGTSAWNGSSRASSVPPVPKKREGGAERPGSAGVGIAALFNNVVWNRSRDAVESERRSGHRHTPSVATAATASSEASTVRIQRPATAHTKAEKQDVDQGSIESSGGDSWTTA